MRTAPRTRTGNALFLVLVAVLGLGMLLRQGRVTGASMLPTVPALAAGGVFGGRVYEGDVGDQTRPLTNVTVELYGANEPYPNSGGLLDTTTTNEAGWYGLDVERGFTYYSIRPSVPTGYTAVGATTVSGTVRSSTWIEYAAPLDGKDLTGNKFWVRRATTPSATMPAATATRTSTSQFTPGPTSTPSRTATHGPTSTRTATHTAAPSPTATPGYQVAYTLCAGDDASIYESSPDNYGTSQYLLVGYIPSDEYHARRSLIHFDLSLPTNTFVQSASLRLYAEEGAFGPTSVSIGVYVLMASWDQDTVTWLNQPAIPPEDPVASLGIGDSAGWVSWDVTELARAWVSGAMPNYGVELRGPTDIGAWTRGFSSREGAHCPELVLNLASYVPVQTPTPRPTWTVTSTPLPECPTADKAGSSFATAGKMTTSDQLYWAAVGYICPRDDEDWWKFTVTRGCTIDLALSGYQGGELPADYNLELYNPSGTLVQYSRRYGTYGENISLDTCQTGDWRVLVWPAQSSEWDSTYPYRLIAELTPKTDLSILGVEVTQAIQDLSNGVVLVAGKATLVRVYLDASADLGGMSGVTALLSGWTSSGSLPGSPLKAGPVTVQHASVAAQRERAVSQGLHFHLPTSWTPVTEDVSMQVTIFAPSGTYECGSNNTKDLTVSFDAAHEINVGYVLVTASGYTPSKSDAFALSAYIKAAYPLSKVRTWFYVGSYDVDYDFTNTEGGGCYDPWNDLVGDMVDIYDSWDDRPDWAFVYGLLDSNVPHGSVVGCGRSPGNGAAGLVHKYGGETIAEELAHNLGRKHSPCGSPANIDGDWPYDTNPGGELDEVGVNLINEYLYNGYNSGVKAQAYDIMGYCNPQWPAIYTYEALWEQLKSSSGAGSASMQNASFAVGEQALYLYASGQIQGGQVRVSKPFYQEMDPVGSHDHPGLGFYSLELQDAAGVVLFERRFDPRDPYEGTTPDDGSFHEILPWRPGTRRIVIKHWADPIWTREVSAHAPQVIVTSPSGGEHWEAQGLQTIRWTATDPDGDPMRASVLYSPDDGRTWRLLASNLMTDTFRADPSWLPASPNARTRVRVTDGVNTTSAVCAGPFGVAPKGPQVGIMAPEQGHLFRPGEPVVLSGWAYDVDQGELPGEAMHWVSDRDGPLAEGEQAVLQQLSPGVHHIRLEAQDGTGQVGMTSVEIEVGYRANVPIVARGG